MGALMEGGWREREENQHNLFYIIMLSFSCFLSVSLCRLLSVFYLFALSLVQLPGLVWFSHLPCSELCFLSCCGWWGDLWGKSCSLNLHTTIDSVISGLLWIHCCNFPKDAHFLKRDFLRSWNLCPVDSHDYQKWILGFQQFVNRICDCFTSLFQPEVQFEATLADNDFTDQSLQLNMLVFELSYR